MARKNPQRPRLVYTIGHSTRSDVEMADLLKENGVRLLVDVRMVPRSRTNPQFNTETFAEFLASEDIEHMHVAELGGLRKPRKDSANTVWENYSFRGYADYMETDQFRDAVDELLQIAAKRGPVAIMCSEAVWWRCHRSMIADELTARGIEVKHIMGPGKAQLHKLRSFARAVDDHVSYR